MDKNIMIAKINNELLRRFTNNGFSQLTLNMKEQPPKHVVITPLIENSSNTVAYYNVQIHELACDTCNTLKEVAEMIANAKTIYKKKESEIKQLNQLWENALKGKNSKDLQLGLMIKEKYQRPLSEEELKTECETYKISIEEGYEILLMTDAWILFKDKYQKLYGRIPNYSELNQ